MTTEDCCCINNTGNEVIEPLAHRNDEKGIFYACQDPLPLDPSKRFSVEVIDCSAMEPMVLVRNGEGPFAGMTWEKLDKVLEDCTKEDAEPVRARDPRLYVVVPADLCSHLKVDDIYVVPRNDNEGCVNLCYAGNGIFDIVQLTPEAIDVMMKEYRCSLEDCLLTKDKVDMDTLRRHIVGDYHKPPLMGTGGETDAFKGDWRDSEGYRRYLLSEGGGIMPYSKRIRFQYAKYVREQFSRMINFRFR